MSLREMLSGLLVRVSTSPRLEGELGPMGERYELFVAVPELVRVEALLPYFRGQTTRASGGGPRGAFIAKAVDVPTARPDRASG